MTLRINLGKARSALGATCTYNLTQEKLDLQVDLEIVKPLQINFQLKNTGHVLELKGQLETVIITKCDRCLEEVLVPISTDFNEKLVHVTDLKFLGDLPQEQIEENYLIFDKDILDLADIVRENIFLALPLKTLCAENCRGICQICGQNLNIENCNCTSEEIDPRLAILAKLKRD